MKNKQMEKETNNKKQFIIIISFCILFFAFIFNVYCYANDCKEYTYYLNEIKEDVFAITYNTHSRTPAENYSVVTLCCDGTIRTFEGNVYISYVENQKPYAKILDYNIVHGDKIYVYIPSKTIKFKESINIEK